MTAALRLPALSRIGSSFGCAAHSAVGSSHASFARVTAMALSIIYTKDLTEDGLTAVMWRGLQLA